MIGAFEQSALAVMVFFIMLGMGATVRWSEFRNVLKAPKAFWVGIMCQFGLMPAIALSLALAFDLPAAIALSLIMVGATPGGTTSNLFTYYAKGDVALSVSMTVASTLAAIVLMPFAIAIYASRYTSDALQVPFGNIVVTLVLILIPVAIGAYALHRSARLAGRLEKLGSLIGFLLIAALVIKFLTENTAMFVNTPTPVIAAAILLGLIGFLLGYVCARIFGLAPSQARTVSLETGIQNTPLTLAVITLSFATGTQQDEMLLLPTFYAFFIVLTSALVAFGFRTGLGNRIRN